MSFSDMSIGSILIRCPMPWRVLTLEDIYYEGPLGSRDDTLILNLKTGEASTGCFIGDLARLKKRVNAASPAYRKAVKRDGYLEALPRFYEALEKYRRAHGIESPPRKVGKLPERDSRGRFARKAA